MLESGHQTIQYGHQTAAILKDAHKAWNWNAESNLSYTPETMRTKPDTKNLIWPPGSYFKDDIAENQYASIHTLTEGCDVYSKPN